MLLIGISGLARSGKDTVAQAILDAYPAMGRRIAFADALKREVANVCGVSLATIRDNKQLFRPMLQWWGTEFRRAFGQNDSYWIDQVRLSVDVARGTCKFIVIPDVRFPNESNYIRAEGGVLIRVTRPSLVSTDTHSSETALEAHAFDHFILNNSPTLEDFKYSLSLFVTHNLPPSLIDA